MKNSMITGFHDFPFTGETVKLVREFLDLEDLGKRLEIERSEARKALIGLQKEGLLGAPVKVAKADRATRLSAAREKVIDHESKIEALEELKSEKRQQIFEAMRADRDVRLQKIPELKEAASTRLGEAQRGFLTAMAAAAVAQGLYLGNFNGARSSGPELAGYLSSNKDDWDFYQSEIDRVLKEKGLSDRFSSAHEMFQALVIEGVRLQETEVSEVHVDQVIDWVREGNQIIS